MSGAKKIPPSIPIKREADKIFRELPNFPPIVFPFSSSLVGSFFQPTEYRKSDKVASSGFCPFFSEFNVSPFCGKLFFGDDPRNLLKAPEKWERILKPEIFSRFFLFLFRKSTNCTGIIGGSKRKTRGGSHPPLPHKSGRANYLIRGKQSGAFAKRGLAKKVAYIQTIIDVMLCNRLFSRKTLIVGDFFCLLFASGCEKWVTNSISFFCLSFFPLFFPTEQVHLALLGVQDGQADSDQQVKNPQIFA